MGESSYQSHIAWCKYRARVYLNRGELLDAYLSFASDMNKQDDTREVFATMVPIGLHAVATGNQDDLRNFIEGF